MGQVGGAGNLVFSEVLMMHISKDILDGNDRIDPLKLDLVGRMGGTWYNRASAGMFEVPKPLASKGIGVDAIAEGIRKSTVLTGNDLGQLGNVERIPTAEEVAAFLKENIALKVIISAGDPILLHQKAKEYLNNNDTLSAWKVLMANE